MKEIGASNIRVLIDSQLIVNQVMEIYQVKEQQVATYLAKVKELIGSFQKFEIK